MDINQIINHLTHCAPYMISFFMGAIIFVFLSPYFDIEIRFRKKVRVN